jgi:ATP-dependent Clp protease ATP-binding subunit ClpA
MTRYDAVNFIAHGVAQARAPKPRPVRGAQEGEDGERVVKQGSEALAAYCVNLNKKAREGKIDPLIGREAEVLRAIQILCRRRKNNPLLVGDPGVGKTAIAEGLARKINEKQVPAFWPTRRSSRSTWARCWRARAIAATSKSA